MRSLPDGAIRAEPNVTPMIDVMLVLLVIFMIVVPVMTSGTSAVPPQAQNLTPRPPDAAEQTLAIDRQGRYYLNKRSVDTDVLPAALRAAFATRATDHVLYLTADKNLEYSRVLDVLDIAGKSGVRVVGMVGETPPETPRR